MERRRLWGVGVGLLFVLLLVVLHQSGVFATLSPDILKAKILSFGPLAPLVFIGCYILACVLFLPGSPLSLLGGALFGPLYGTIYVVVGATIGATLAFFGARFIGGGLIGAGSGDVAKRLKAYDASIAAHGLTTVLFFRLVPLFPFNGLNVGLGLTSVRVRHYVLGTLFGIMPGTFAYVFFGDSLFNLDLRNIVIGIVLLVLLTLLGRYIATRQAV